MKNNYTIIPTKTDGIFKVINNEGKEYLTDIHTPNCSCKRFKYTR